MTKVDLEEAGASLSELVDKALSGEEVILTRQGQPLVRLVSVASASGRRPIGLHATELSVADDFDETDKEIIDSFYNSKIFPDE